MITVHNIGIIFNKLLNESILLDRRLSFFFYAFVILKKNEKKERERNVNAFFFDYSNCSSRNKVDDSRGGS